MFKNFPKTFFQLEISQMYNFPQTLSQIINVQFIHETFSQIINVQFSIHETLSQIINVQFSIHETFSQIINVQFSPDTFTNHKCTVYS